MTISERLAGLTGRDRECDLEVSWLLLPPEDKTLFDGVRHVAVMWGPDGPWFTSLTEYHQAPRWTSDLSAVVAEIERRGWNWSVGVGGSNRQPYADVFIGREMPQFLARTPCLALLRALVSAVEAEHAHVPT